MKGDKLYDEEDAGNITMSTVDDLKETFKKIVAEALQHSKYYSEITANVKDDLYDSEDVDYLVSEVQGINDNDASTANYF